MAEEPDDVTRRVVKKVVKKTVVRPMPSARPNGQAPASTAAPSSSPAPIRRLRSARLATPTRPAARTSTPATPAASPVSPERVVPPPIEPSPAPQVSAPARPTPPTAPVEAAPTARHTKPAKPGKPPKAPKKPKPEKSRRWPAKKPKTPKDPKPPRPKRDLDLGGRLSDARYAITDPIQDGFARLGDLIADGWHWLIGLRLPKLSPVKGSAITGVLVGLLSVLFGFGFSLLFSAVRGTSAGGGWGFLAIVFVAFIAFIAGELLLSGFGVPLPRVVSILSVLLTLLVVLVFFVKLAAGAWAWLIIPAVAALAFVVSSAAMRIASQEKNDQRLPWEPTSESHIKID